MCYTRLLELRCSQYHTVELVSKHTRLEFPAPISTGALWPSTVIRGYYWSMSPTRIRSLVIAHTCPTAVLWYIIKFIHMLIISLCYVNIITSANNATGTAMHKNTSLSVISIPCPSRRYGRLLRLFVYLLTNPAMP